jgi:hypothetical protein
MQSLSEVDDEEKSSVSKSDSQEVEKNFDFFMLKP